MYLFISVLSGGFINLTVYKAYIATSVHGLFRGFNLKSFDKSLYLLDNKSKQQLLNLRDSEW